MSEKRMDSRGRILRTGESQRKDGLYQYRYTDIHGKRQTVYSPDLKELREKERAIQRNLEDGIDYAAGKVTVTALVERYISLKQGVRYNTRFRYQYVLNLLKNDAFGSRRIRDIRVSDAKQWFLQLHAEGRGYSTLASVRCVMRPAFQMAYQEGIIRRNPFDFKLGDLVPNDSRKRAALTDAQQAALLDFVQADQTSRRYYDEFVVLLGTGLRVSEFCGLTVSDLNFERRCICVQRQLMRKGSSGYHVEKPKTESGVRFIPMTDEVYGSLKNIMAHRKQVKVEPVVDGCGGFLLLDKNSHPKVALHIENELRGVMQRYAKAHPDEPLPKVTPHVLRHTFCTNMANAGMDVKNLQYLMGHANVSVTLNVYTHASYEKASAQMAKILEFRREKQRSFG